MREVYERAIANVPPVQEKRHWKRYIYLWINYALYEELEAKVQSRVLGWVGAGFSPCALALLVRLGTDTTFYKVVCFLFFGVFFGCFGSLLLHAGFL